MPIKAYFRYEYRTQYFFWIFWLLYYTKNFIFACCLGGFHLRIALTLLKYDLFYSYCMHALPFLKYQSSIILKISFYFHRNKYWEIFIKLLLLFMRYIFSYLWVDAPSTGVSFVIVQYKYWKIRWMYICYIMQRIWMYSENLPYVMLSMWLDWHFKFE